MACTVPCATVLLRGEVTSVSISESRQPPTDTEPAINELSMLSDQRTAALVTPDARITWMCLPRIDSGALFAELVGGPSAGYFSIQPHRRGDTPVQQYVDDSLVLRTRWSSMAVTDYLDCSDGRPTRNAGRTDLVRVLEGSGRAALEFAPRLDFGRVPTRLDVRDGGLAVLGADDPIVLRSPGVEWTCLLYTSDAADE